MLRAARLIGLALGLLAAAAAPTALAPLTVGASPSLFSKTSAPTTGVDVGYAPLHRRGLANVGCGLAVRNRGRAAPRREVGTAATESARTRESAARHMVSLRP
jgi:hypothetical protein